MTIDSAEEQYSQVGDDMGVGWFQDEQRGSCIGVNLGGKKEAYSLRIDGSVCFFSSYWGWAFSGDRSLLMTCTDISRSIVMDQKKDPSVIHRE